MKTISAPPADKLKAMPPSKQTKELRQLVDRWVNGEELIINGMWPLLGDLIKCSWAPDSLRAEAVGAVQRQAAFIGSDSSPFLDAVKDASPNWRAEALAALARHKAAAKMLAELANDKRVEVAARRVALRALANTPESPLLLRLATKLQSEGPLKSAAQHVLKSFESRRSSTLDQIVGLSSGDVLRDRGRPVKIDQILDLGSMDFGATTLEFWDPVQVEPQYLKVKVPAGRAQVFAALSGQWARSLKIKFSSSKVAGWHRVGRTSGPFGTLVLSRVGPRTEIEQMEFVSNFWDEVFDEAFDPSDGAAVVELQLGKKSVPLLAWNDSQMGGTLYRGEDVQGGVAALLFDGVRISPEVGPSE